MQKETIGYFSNESAIAITVKVLNVEYPNVEFEAVEFGDGRYQLNVFSKYERRIPYSVMVTFKNVSWVVYKSIPVIEKELGL